MGFERQMTRRDVLRAGSRLAILSTVSALYATPRAAAAEPFAVRTTWEQHDIPLSGGVVQSPALATDTPFNAVESQWSAVVPPGATLELSLRTSAYGLTWTDWTHIHADTHARDLNDTEPFGDLLIVAPSQYIQYRIEAAPD